MLWIDIVRMSEADESLREVFRKLRPMMPKEYRESGDKAVAHQRKSKGGASEVGIVASHSLIPQAMYHAFALINVLMDEDLPLTRRQHEMIATVVSTENECFY